MTMVRPRSEFRRVAPGGVATCLRYARWRPRPREREDGRVSGVPIQPIQPISRAALRADCSACIGLCCVALTLTRSADFAIDKPAGEPCPNLRSDFRCAIHASLRERGFPGCVAYDCFGAGQRVTARFGGRGGSAGRTDILFSSFRVAESVHELLWYLAEAHDLTTPASNTTGHSTPAPSHPAVLTSLQAEVVAAWDATLALADLDAAALPAADVSGHRAGVVDLLGRVSDAVRAAVGSRTLRPGSRTLRPGSGKTTSRAGLRPRADLIGTRLPHANLRGANLRGALLIAADLSGADLSYADLIGADLRDAILAGADLSRALFLTQRQVSAARGDHATQLPPWLSRPAHWW